jgi:pyridoxal phosphate enzyme (YggS family)
MGTIRENITRLHATIRETAERVGRDADDITLLVVTKNRTVEQIRELLECGDFLLGENRVQEAKSKIPLLPQTIHWHMIGHLQRNKVKEALQLFEMIQSVDSLRLAREIQKIADAMDRSVDLLVEVNVAGEETKYGIPPDETQTFIRELSALPRLHVKGLMTMAPFTHDQERVRPYFRRVRELFDELAQAQIQGIEMNYLSMGMSNDYRVAVEEGSNMLRIGSAVFD